MRLPSMTSRYVKYKANYNIALTLARPRIQTIPFVCYFVVCFCGLYNVYKAHDAVPREIFARKELEEDINKTTKQVMEFFHNENTKKLPLQET